MAASDRLGRVSCHRRVSAPRGLAEFCLPLEVITAVDWGRGSGSATSAGYPVRGARAEIAAYLCLFQMEEPFNPFGDPGGPATPAPTAPGASAASD